MKQKPKYGICSNIGYMLRMAWKHQKRVIFMLLLTVSVTIGLNLTELFVAPAILHRVEEAAPMTRLLSTIGIFTALLLLLKTLNSFCEGWAKIIPQTFIRTRIVHDLHRKSLTTAYPNTCDPKVSKILSGAMRATENNRDAAEHIWDTMSGLLSAAGGFGIYLLLLETLPPLLLAAVIATSVAGFFASRWSDNWQYRHRDEVHAFYTKASYLRTKARSIESAKDIRIFGLQGWLMELYDSLIRAHSSWFRKLETVGFRMDFLNVLLAFLRNGIAYAFLLHQAITAHMSTANFLLYFSAVSGFTTWITILLQNFEMLYRESLDISTIREYLNYPEPFRFEGGRPIPPAEAYELRAEDVTFRYPGAERNLFEHLNLTVHPGEKLAVVGLNGAGKTTLVMLLCGFYDPTEGRILLNGQDIREFNRREYYDLLSAVYQQYSVVDATVAENVASDVEQMDRQRVEDCLRKAGLEDFVKGLPKQLDTPVGRDVYMDGVLFSGGQTQRLMLARALYKDGPVLVLDEPTAALDPIAENDIYQKYSAMTEGKTSLFISHRLASTRFCDRIIFLENGRITEEGTHDCLMKQNGAYARLFEVQARYYQEGRDFR